MYTFGSFSKPSATRSSPDLIPTIYVHSGGHYRAKGGHMILSQYGMSNQEALSVCHVHHSIHPLRDQNWAHTWIINRAADSVSTFTHQRYTPTDIMFCLDFCYAIQIIIDIKKGREKSRCTNSTKAKL